MLTDRHALAVADRIPRELVLGVRFLPLLPLVVVLSLVITSADGRRGDIFALLVLVLVMVVMMVVMGLLLLFLGGRDVFVVVVLESAHG
jgi:hypothetical protein